MPHPDEAAFALALARLYDSAALQLAEGQCRPGQRHEDEEEDEQPTELLPLVGVSHGVEIQHLQVDRACEQGMECILLPWNDEIEILMLLRSLVTYSIQCNEILGGELLGKRKRRLTGLWSYAVAFCWSVPLNSLIIIPAQL